ncbi:hypothetical protein [Planobispora takensis]|nr:hypothetical protein [Planobispora takensis]
MLDRQGPVPVYIQIADMVQRRIIADRIRRGEIEVNRRIPSEKTLIS